MAFTLVTWNVLATAYIRATFYPRTPVWCLDPEWRHPRITLRAISFDADVLCLQEVDADVFGALYARLASAGYFGELALKEGKPEGCATFVRQGCFTKIESRRVAYHDGGGAADSGHIAHVVTADHDGARVTFLNTHLKWDPPRTPVEQQWSMKQAREALDVLADTKAAAEIVCGDLNVTPESDVVRALQAAGFDYAHKDGEVMTCNSNSVAKLIDYVFFRGVLRVVGQRPRVIDGRTPLPSDDEPSDHLPLVAECRART